MSSADKYGDVMRFASVANINRLLVLHRWWSECPLNSPLRFECFDVPLILTETSRGMRNKFESPGSFLTFSPAVVVLARMVVPRLCSIDSCQHHSQNSLVKPERKRLWALVRQIVSKQPVLLI